MHSIKCGCCCLPACLLVLSNWWIDSTRHSMRLYVLCLWYKHEILYIASNIESISKAYWTKAWIEWTLISTHEIRYSFSFFFSVCNVEPTLYIIHIAHIHTIKNKSSSGIYVYRLRCVSLFRHCVIVVFYPSLSLSKPLRHSHYNPLFGG